MPTKILTTALGRRKKESILNPLGKVALESDQPGGTGPQGPSLECVGGKETAITAHEDEWAELVQRICATQLNPDDPVMGFLRNRGYDLGGIGGI